MQHELDAGLLVVPFRHRPGRYGYAIQLSTGRYVSQNALQLKIWLIDHA